jgi:hypothetical protein
MADTFLTSDDLITLGDCNPMRSPTARDRFEVLKSFVHFKYPKGLDSDINGKRVFKELLRTPVKPGKPATRAQQALYKEVKKISDDWHPALSQRVQMPDARWNTRADGEQIVLPDKPEIILPYLPTKSEMVAIAVLQYWPGPKSTKHKGGLEFYDSIGYTKLILGRKLTPFWVGFWKGAEVTNEAWRKGHTAPRCGVTHPDMDDDDSNVEVDLYFRQGRIDRTSWMNVNPGEDGPGQAVFGGQAQAGALVGRGPQGDSGQSPLPEGGGCPVRIEVHPGVALGHNGHPPVAAPSHSAPAFGSFAGIASTPPAVRFDVDAGKAGYLHCPCTGHISGVCWAA